MSYDELAQSLPWREKVHENEYTNRQDSALSSCPLLVYCHRDRMLTKILKLPVFLGGKKIYLYLCKLNIVV